MQEVQQLIKDYQERYKIWEDLLQEESEKRSEIMAEGEDPEEEPEDLRERLEHFSEKSGLRDRQKEALASLKDAEAALFSYQLENCTSAMKDDLQHLARDYAGRITWLKQFLPQEAPDKDDKKKK